MTVKERYEGLQTVLEQGGKYGCLFLCLCSIVEDVTLKPLDLVEAIHTSQERGWLGRDFTCNNQLAFLEHYTGLRWKRTEVKTLDRGVKENEWTVEKWRRGTKTHFKRRGFDVYKNSVTVRDGCLFEYYVYTSLGVL